MRHSTRSGEDALQKKAPFVPVSTPSTLKHRSSDRKSFLHLGPDLGPLEGAYRESTLRLDAGQVRVLLYVYLVVTLVYGLIDYQLFGISKTFFILVIVRGLLLLAMGSSVLILRRISSYVLMDRLVLLIGLAIAGLTLYVNTTRPPTYFFNAPLDVLMVVTFYLAVPNRLLFRAIPATVFSLGDLVLFQFFRTGVDPIGVRAVVFSLLAANIGSCLLSIQLYTYRRNQFKAQYVERLAREEVERLATTDSLTGVLNRQRFLEAAEIEFQRFQRYHRSFCLLFIDLDHLKQLNDTYGHLAGDVALQQFGAMLRAQIRKTDMVGRLGGDEFAVLLPETSTKEAVEIAGRICTSCARLIVRVEDHEARLTASIGVTEAHPGDASLGETLNRSDRALYHVKHHGRNNTYLIGAQAGD